MSRVRAGFCEVPNPFRRGQVTRVSLNPAEVDAVVFWTRNPLPLLPHLKELDRLGLRYVFLVTILGYPPELDPGCLPPARAVQAFQRLSEHLGPDRVTWRYDPLILTPTTDADWHRRQFAELARKLQGHTRRCKLSLVDLYAKLGPRLRALQGTPHQFGPAPLDGVLLRDLAGGPAAGDRTGELRGDRGPAAFRHPTWSLHRCRPAEHPVRHPDPVQKGPRPAPFLWLRGQSRHRHVRLLSGRVFLLLCRPGLRRGPPPPPGSRSPGAQDARPARARRRPLGTPPEPTWGNGCPLRS